MTRSGRSIPCTNFTLFAVWVQGAATLLGCSMNNKLPHIQQAARSSPQQPAKPERPIWPLVASWRAESRAQSSPPASSHVLHGFGRFLVARFPVLPALAKLLASSRLCAAMISSLADQLWRRGVSRGSLNDERDHHGHRDPEKHARKQRHPRALKCPARTIVLGVVAVAVLCLGLWWLGTARTAGSGDGTQTAAPASAALRGAPMHRSHNHGVKDHHVPRSVRLGAPAFQSEWGLPESPDFGATGLELPSLGSRVVSAWGSPEAIARAATEARVAAAAVGGRGAGAGWDVPPAAHAKADADVTVVVSPKDLFNITQQVPVRRLSYWTECPPCRCGVACSRLRCVALAGHRHSRCISVLAQRTIHSLRAPDGVARRCTCKHDSAS